MNKPNCVIQDQMCYGTLKFSRQFQKYVVAFFFKLSCVNFCFNVHVIVRPPM